MPPEFDWQAAKEKFDIDLTPEQKAELNEIASQVNVLNGLTQASSFGADMVVSAMDTFEAADGEALIAKVRSSTSVTARPPSSDATPIGKLLNK